MLNQWKQRGPWVFPQKFLWLLRLSRLIVTQHQFPRHIAVGYDQCVVFFPPTDVPAFAAEEANHLNHVGNFRRTQRWAEGRHDATPFSDRAPDLGSVFLFHGLPEVRHADRE